MSELFPAARPLRTLTLFLAGLGLALAAAAAATVRISGTGSGTGGMQLMADAFMRAHPDVKVEVVRAVGSSGGISALVAGKLELAVSNRPPNAKESAQAALTAVEYARTPFVVAVHRNLGLSSLSEAEFSALFAPGAATFPSGARVRPVFRLADATDTLLLKSIVPAAARAIDEASTRRGMLSADTDSDAVELIETVPGAIGTTTLAQITSERRPLVALAIGNKVPSLANLAAGHYPHFKSLYLVTTATAAPAIQRFVAFVSTPAAQALLRAHGHLPR